MNAQTEAASQAAEAQPLIAPRWHTLLLLGFLAVPLVTGVMIQGGHSGHQILSNHSAAMLRFYVPVLIYEWLLVLFVWFGVRITGTTLGDLIGGRWQSWKGVARDGAIGVAVWAVLLGIGALAPVVLGADTAKAINVIMPRGPFEAVVWVIVAATAGFVEELVFRGYLQTQLRRMGLPVVLAIAGQAIVFSLGHAYEGRNAIVVIAFYAVLLGGLAAWRRSLRPGMIGHVVFDVSVVFFMGG